MATPSRARNTATPAYAACTHYRTESLGAGARLAEAIGRVAETSGKDAHVDLRPAGVTEFDGRRIDTLSEGPLIEAGKWVRCIEVHAGKVVVREVERPPAVEDMDFGELT